MKKVWLTILAIVSMLIGIILMFKTYPFPSLRWFNLAQYGWILFILGGLLIAIRKAWSFTAYIFIGILFILYDIFILGVLVFFGFFMNDMGTPMPEVVQSLLTYLSSIMPYIFYWIVTMVYLNKVREMFRQ